MSLEEMIPMVPFKLNYCHKSQLYLTTDDTSRSSRTFLQQLQQEWSRFVTIVKQQHDLDTFSYHKLFDVLKQSFLSSTITLTNPISNIPKQSSSTISNAPTKFKGKEIAKPITPLSESAYEEDSDLEQAQRDKDMYKNDNQNGQVGNQRTVTVAGARETVGSQVNTCEYNVFANERQHSEQPESISNTCVVKKVDSNVIPNSPDMCVNDIQFDQNAEDERVALANLIPNLKLDVIK
ncbi:hypothetical protein Tco_0394307 [Tanacetum coccineum]